MPDWQEGRNPMPRKDMQSGLPAAGPTESGFSPEDFAIRNGPLAWQQPEVTLRAVACLVRRSRDYP